MAEMSTPKELHDLEKSSLRDERSGDSGWKPWVNSAMPAKTRSTRLRIDMPFEDAVRLILKAAPMPKTKRTGSKRRAKKVTKKR
jgi:hypothetical protein